MASNYSRTVPFSATGGVSVCVELPLPMQGALSRLIITQRSGVAVTAAFTLYDRKGACSVATDLNVTGSGTVVDVATSGGFAAITTSATHSLKIGNTLEVKGSSVAAYNVTHTVTSVPSTTQVVTDIAFTAAGAGGYWQTSPYNPTMSPVTHMVLTDTKLDSADYISLVLDRPYENRDNQSITLRSRYAALWLSFLPAGTGAKTWEVAYTSKVDDIS